MARVHLLPIAEGSAPATVDLEGSAAGLLERAFMHFQDDQHSEAAHTFRAAIGTGNLNDAGRALAYWHIFLSDSLNDREDDGADALASFVVVGQDVLDSRNTMRYAVTTSGDFVERFNLSNRLSKARAMLSVKWANRMPQFGHSVDEPIPVFDEAEAEHFVHLASPCSEAIVRDVSRDVIHDGQTAHIERITIDCTGAPAPVEFYIEFIQR